LSLRILLALRALKFKLNLNCIFVFYKSHFIIECIFSGQIKNQFLYKLIKLINEVIFKNWPFMVIFAALNSVL